MNKSNWNATYKIGLGNLVGKDKMAEIRKAIAAANKSKKN